MLIFSVIMFWLGFGAKHLLGYKKKTIPLPQLETTDDILAYLEAFSTDNNKKLIQDFSSYLSQPLLPSKPEYYHSTHSKPTAEQHWEIFLEDLNLEAEPLNKIRVISHWLKRNNVFTIKEQSMMLSFFSNASDREKIRKLFTKNKTSKQNT